MSGTTLFGASPAWLVFEANTIANHITQSRSALIGDPPRHRHGRDTSRLGDGHSQATFVLKEALESFGIQQILGDLGRLAWPRLSHNNDDPILHQHVNDILAIGQNRQIFWRLYARSTSCWGNFLFPCGFFVRLLCRRFRPWSGPWPLWTSIGGLAVWLGITRHCMQSAQFKLPTRFSLQVSRFLAPSGACLGFLASFEETNLLALASDSIIYIYIRLY